MGIGLMLIGIFRSFNGGGRNGSVIRVIGVLVLLLFVGGFIVLG